ncbi:uncharacterized protein LOC105702679 [Orussus abietinus]|uniref:uncharacterized protein LOC105702679 n=1 Tax=Orussus abietinus TaxID=222816 RepID=UPI000626BA7C|nr:uncharacterized protein LOC105702679 [Orussus abietinus]
MILVNQTAIAVFMLTFIICVGCTSSECIQQSPCSCVFPDGTGYDLSELEKEGYLSTVDDSRYPNYVFYFHPCKDVPIKLDNKTTECSSHSGVSLCMKKDDVFFNLGTSKEVEMKSQPLIQSLVFHHMKNTTTINFVCTHAHLSSSLQIDILYSEKSEYHLVLSSAQVCLKQIYSKGLSTGSLLVILLFVFSGVYFFGGALIKKCLSGATGWEMVPNYAFWMDLPALVKDGFSFTFSSCRNDSYEAI